MRLADVALGLRWLVAVDSSEGLEPWLPVLLTLACLAPLCLILILWFKLRASDGARHFLRFVGFVALHVADYSTNVLTMYIVVATNHPKYLFLLAPVHCMIGLFCMLTAAHTTKWQQWACAPICNFLFLVVVLGLMQGVQLKLAHEDYMQHRAAAQGEGRSNLQVPATMPARFHCKAMDGVLEGTVFSFVSMYALLKSSWVEPDSVNLVQWHKVALYVGSFFSFLTAGLALMEVDHRTSTAVQRLLDQSTFAQARHLLFRASEFSLRLLTVLVFCAFMRPIASIWWVAFVLIAVDYLFGVCLLVFLGGRDPVQEAAVLLGGPLFMVNVMQFVDAPGMSLQARRISSVIVPFRAAELLGILAFCGLCTHQILVRRSSGAEQAMSMWAFLLEMHPEWLAAWVMNGLTYYILLPTYACRVKPGADLHSAVAYGEVDSLKQLLCSSELVLDINRYGPDGRTPLHLAALRGQVDCMRLLIEERANVNALTGNKQRNTALHLAAMNKSPIPIRFLCHVSGGDAAFLNLANADGDTALHIAARRQNVAALQELLREPGVNIRLANSRGQAAADCAPSDKFGFDRNSAEYAIAELFRHAEAGILPQRTGSLELSDFGSTARSSSAAGAGISSADLEAEAAESQPARRPHEFEEGPVSNQARHSVPLLTVKKSEEDEFLKRTNPQLMNSGRESLLVTNCGISSFMLSAGLGALSRTMMNSIREEPDDAAGSAEYSSVRASFEDFTEIKMLGEGAFGKVLLVRQKETGELFAMKLMDKAKFKAQKITSKAVSEQFILKTTRHPFIVSLHFAFQGSSFWALVMDFCPNGDLQALLVAYGTPGLPLPDGARLAGEVMLALEHLHSISVIFRDLKLENVVLDADHRAKVTDFGLAKKLYSAADARTMCGSYGYAAPEIILNTGRYTYAVDLYSFGVMLYMMVSGGEEAQKSHKQRLPPMKHSGLRKKLRDAEKDGSLDWARPEIGALALLNNLTSEDPQVRTTCTEVKHNVFFTQLLGQPVDGLLTMKGPFHPKRSSGPASSGSQV